MIKDNQKLLNQIHVVIDILIIIIAFTLAYYLRFNEHSPLNSISYLEISGYFYPFRIYSRSLLLLIPGYILIYFKCNMYGPKRSRGRSVAVDSTIYSNLIGIVYFTFLMVIFKQSDSSFSSSSLVGFMDYFKVFGDTSRWFLFIFFLLNVTLDIVFRFSLVTMLRHFRKKGYNLKHVLVVGYSRAAERYIKRLKYNPEWGYQIHGILDDTMPRNHEYLGIPIIGTLDELPNLLSKNTLDEIAITISISEYAKLASIVNLCEKSGVHTKFIPDYNNIISSRPYTEDLFGLPVINIRNVPLSNVFNKTIKRCIDIFGAVVALLIFSIPMIVVSIIIKTTSNGPLIFKQTRVGLHNKEFSMYKFRSMAQQAPDKEKVAWTTINDPRVTPIGKFIRKTSIDELPQLFNVLKGDMSLIGPRPERPFFVEKFKEEIPRYMIKHQVRPGLTGWAQVNGYRGDTSIKLRIEHDLYYIENWTLGFDFKILFLTIFKGFINKNAY